MPWTTQDPPSAAKNWTTEQRRKCVAAANAVLEEGGSEQEAIYACIHAAGKGKRMKDAIARVIEKISGRAIKDSESWDGSPSRWPSTEAYCASCLIDVNDGEKKQSHCKLPVKDPGSSAYNRKALAAAAARFNQLTKPADVPEEKWASAVASARRKLIAAYKEMGEDPPENLRAISLSNIWSSVAEGITAQNPECSALDLYIDDDGGLRCIFAVGGKVYSSQVLLGDEISLGEPSEVAVEFTPRKRSILIQRQQDGAYRWFAIAETAVLLRVGEIDSRDLFDDFISNVPTHGYPVLRFYHEPSMTFGRADFIEREGNCLLLSGTLDDHPLSGALVQSIERGDTWGTSVGFTPTDEPEMWQIMPGVHIPVNRRGILNEVSVCPEDRAASYFTNITTGVTRMRTEVEEALIRLFGDEQKAREYIALVDDTNRSIDEAGMITRDAGVADSKEPSEDTTEYEALKTRIDELCESLPKLLERTEGIEKAHDEATKSMEEGLTKVIDLVGNISARIDALESQLEDRMRELSVDMPAKYRPRLDHATEQKNMGSVAEATLAAIQH